MIRITYLRQCGFQYFVEGFYGAICLWMIWGTFLMLHLQFFCLCFYCAVEKVTTLVTHQYPRASKPCHNVFKYELCCCRSGAIHNWWGLRPPCQIVSCGDYVPCTHSLPWWVYGTHKFYSPFIKRLQSYLWYKRHFIPLWWIPNMVKDVAVLRIIYSIIMQSRPP